MNKYLLSFIIIISFILYALRNQTETNQTIPKITGISANQNHTDFSQNGIYQGNTIATVYGNLQLQATVQNGTLTQVEFLQYPHYHEYSQTINRKALPRLAQEAIQNQNAEVDTYTGATETTNAFRQSLQSILNKAKGS